MANHLAASIVICPLCTLTLIENDKSYCCANLHHFDKSRQGYVNLLVVNQKKSANPGDNKEMIQSRLAFLSKNYYLPVATAFCELIAAQCAQNPSKVIHIADSGCGEGYYLRKCKEFVDAQINKSIFYYGIDISKDAIKLAAVSNKDISWFVGTMIRLPFLTQSIDILTAIFAPHDFSEFHRVLNDDGLLIIATPENNHLIELRNILFDTVTSKDQNKMLDLATQKFELEKTLPVQYQCELQNKEDIRNLLTMTPFFFKSSKTQQENLFLLDSLTVTVDVKFWVFKKRMSRFDGSKA